MASETQTLQIDSWPIERLIPYARNARTHSDAQVAQIAASIAEFGFVNPVLVDPDGGIIAGHGRVLAARKLAYTHVPVIVLDHLTENQRRAFMLADNKLTLNAGWDPDMLRLELEALAEQNFNLDLTGFEPGEIDELLAEAERQLLVDDDLAPTVEAQAVSLPDEMWSLGVHRVLCGDGTRADDLRRVLEGSSCDLIFTDLPYNVDYCGKGPTKMKLANDNLGADFGSFLLAACTSMLSVSQGPVYMCMSSSELHRLYPAFREAGGHWSTYIIWAKNTFTLGRSDYQRQYEPMLYGWREGVKHFWCGDRDQGDIWFIDKPHSNDLHPTMKPVELVERAIQNSSSKGDLVLDPFAGSGSTLIACEKVGRRAGVVEVDARYVDVIVRRWQTYTGRTAYLDGDGRSFEHIAAERKGAEGSRVQE
jgi:DNA modification methylase